MPLKTNAKAAPVAKTPAKAAPKAAAKPAQKPAKAAVKPPVKKKVATLFGLPLITVSRMTKTETFDAVMEQHSLNTGIAYDDIPMTKRDFDGMIEALSQVYARMVAGADEAFILDGQIKLTKVDVPPRKAGTLVRNPATGEMVKAAAKPASVRFKARVLNKFKKRIVE